MPYPKVLWFLTFVSLAGMTVILVVASSPCSCDFPSSLHPFGKPSKVKPSLLKIRRDCHLSTTVAMQCIFYQYNKIVQFFSRGTVKEVCCKLKIKIVIASPDVRKILTIPFTHWQYIFNFHQFFSNWYRITMKLHSSLCVIRTWVLPVEDHK